MRQDKGRGVVIIDKSKYTTKCLELLQTNNFSKLKHDPTKSFENKTQRTLRKLKTRLSTQQYYQLYPTGSFPGKFCGNEKLHKLPINGTIHNLPIRSAVSNIGTASYHLAKYLAKVLSPLAYSEYTIRSTIDLMNKVKNERIPQGFSMVSFDVKSLFTSVPLEKTIDIALERIYLRKEIATILTKNEMKNLLILCTKNVHFTFNNDIYIQNDGVAMRSPIGPILAGIFMVELKNTLVPKLKQHIKTWRRYVDDTFVYVKNGSIEYVLLVLESFHPNIKFTYEKEVNNTLPFLDVLFIRNSDHIHTTVYRKETNNDLYLHWHAFTPISWKRGTIRTLVNTAYIICSDNNYLQQELKHLERVFHIQNGYPLWIIK